MSSELPLSTLVPLQAQASPAGYAWAVNFPQKAWETGNFEAYQSRFHVAPHLAHLNQYLVKLVSRELLEQGYAGLIVEMPPRHGKSELCSHYFPAWYLGAFPEHRFVLASYEASFAATWGRKARDTFEEWTPHFFPVAIDSRSSAADRWGVRKIQRGRPRNEGGGMFTAGAGGPLTGKGADVLVVDDPIKNATQANSKVQRDNIWDWWTSTARTRLEPNGVILIIMTRWHEDDLVGRLLAAQGDSPQGHDHPLYDDSSDRFLRIRFPMIAEDEDVLGRKPGDALWPQRYDEEAAARIKGSVKGGMRVWEALYQQRPSPREGAMFNRDWFEIVDQVPPGIVGKKRRAWDFAGSEASDFNDPDFTAGALVSMARVNKQPIFYIEDMVRFREQAEKKEKRIRQTAEKDGRGVKIRIEQEPGSAGKDQIAHYKKSVLAGYTVEGKRSTGSKELRADGMAAHAEGGRVKIVRGKWNEDFLTEVEQFPFGAHDDQVDAVGSAIDALDTPSKTVVSW
jgi:predicted phage terminase large subunit-like protein